MIARLQMSDLHLGDPRSVLSNPEIAQKMVGNLTLISGGHIGKLILAGDIWEECVPSNIKERTDGVANSVASASKIFFGDLFARVTVDEVVVIPGNHDLSTWNWYAQNVQKRRTVTPYEGVEVEPVAWPWRHLLPGAPPKLRFAYPLYWDKSTGQDYPMLIVTHGHLFDSLVLGQDPEATYKALNALGCRRPLVPPDVVSVERVAEATLDFCLALWRRYSERDYIFFNQIMRRLDHPQSCTGADMIDAPYISRSCCYQLISSTMSKGDQSPLVQGHSAHFPWFLDMVVMDPYLPTPVGSLRQGPVGPAFTKSSCLTFGHDHLGLHKQMVACGVPFTMVDSGGWTSEYDGHLPHTHVLVWNEVADIVPDSFFLGARTASGLVL
jgi:hypothetical protein